MNKLIFLFFFPVMLFSQTTILGVRGTTVGGAWVGKAYTSTTSDTSQAVSPIGHTKCILNVEVKDCTSLAIYFRPSYDGTTFYPKVYVDSISSANNGGNNYGITLPDWALGCKQIQWVVNFAPFRNGVTSATFNASTILKK